MPEYKEARSFRPKNHFAIHYPVEIFDCGPGEHPTFHIIASDLCAFLGYSWCLHICPEFVTIVCFWLAARAYWCFGFEAKNQEVKVAAEASNYKSVLKSVTSTLSLQSARSLRKRKHGPVVDAILL